MKRCPECEFLYEDEQDRCDMDGTRLSFTGTLPALSALPTPPVPAAAPKSRWAAFTIPLLAVIVMASVLVMLYRMAPNGRTSLSDAQKPASQKALAPSKEPQPETSAASQPKSGAPADSPTDGEPARDPFAAPKTETEKEERSAPASDKKTASPPLSQIQEAPNSQSGNPTSAEPKPATNRVTPITPVPTGQKPAYSISSHPKPPSAAATPTPGSTTMLNANKDSKMNSIFKKAGRILKKPF
jgi:hypothetical protein